MASRIFSNEIQSGEGRSSASAIGLHGTSENNRQIFPGEVSNSSTAAAVLAAASLMLNSASSGNCPSPTSSNPGVIDHQAHPFAWNFVNGNLANSVLPGVFCPKQEELGHMLSLNNGISNTVLEHYLKGLADSVLSSQPLSLQQQVPNGGLIDQASTQEKKDIYVLHEATGLKSFNSGWEAALFILMVEKIGIGEFLERIEDEREKILKQPTQYDFTNSWKYLLIHSDPVWRRSDGKPLNRQPRLSKDLKPEEDSEMLDEEKAEGDSTYYSQRGVKRPNPDCGPDLDGHAEVKLLATDENYKVRSRTGSGIQKSETSSSSTPSENEGRRKVGDSEALTVVKTSSNLASSDYVPHEGKSNWSRTSKVKENRTKPAMSITLGNNKPSEASKALLDKLHISVNRKGELIDYKEVIEWIDPDPESMVKLQKRVISDWMHPNNLKQQDLVCATGLGASYICYLLKDPENTNMSRRRRCEVYSVMTRLFEKYDAGIVTDEHLIEIKNARIRRRRGRRNTAGGGQKNSPEGGSISPQTLSSRGSVDSADAN